MADKERTFFGDSVIYGLSSVLSLGVGIVLIPLYTHALPTADYGLYEILNLASSMLFIFVYMGTINSFVRFYFDKKDKSWRQQVTATSLVFNVISFFVIASAVLVLKDWFVLDIIEDERAFLYLDLLLLWMFCEMLHLIGTTFLQINKLPGYYLVAHILRAVLFVGLALYLLISRERGIDGILTANIVASGIFGGGFLLFALFWTRLKVSLRLMGELLQYGLPYLPAALFSFIIVTSDRFFLNEFYGLSEVGIYTLAAKIGLISTMFLSQAFAKVWAPFVFDNFHREDGPQLIGGIYENYAKLLIGTAFCVALAGPILVPLISAPEYHRAGALIPLICLAAVLQGLGLSADSGMLIAKKTKYKILVGFYGAAAAVAANLLLTASFGMVGAVLAYTAGVLAVLIGNLYFSNRFYPLPVNWLSLAKGAGLAVIVYLAFLGGVQFITTGSSLLRFALSSGVAFLALILFLGATIITGLISYKDLAVFLKEVAKALGFSNKMRIHGKKKLLAKLLRGRYSPFTFLLPHHRFRFPAIITYHRVFDTPADYPMTTSVINATPGAFEEQLVFLKKHFKVINFRMLDQLLKAKEPFPRNSLIITFDDGYFDNHQFALPLLVKHQLTATVFISTGYIDSGRPFWVDKLAFQMFTVQPVQFSALNGKHQFDLHDDNRNAVRVAIGKLCATVSPAEHRQILAEIDEQTGISKIPPRYASLCRPMTWREVQYMDAAGIEIGAHSVMHGFLDQYDDDKLQHELIEPKRRIEEELGKTVLSMAYPSGKFDEKVKRAANSAGYKYCCTFNHGFDNDLATVDFHELSRITIDNHMPLSLYKAQLQLPRLFL